MVLNGVHLLLTYQCTSECDHCFVWGSPWQSGTMTLPKARQVLDQAERLGTVEWFYFEGGEPFLFHPVLVAAARDAAGRGFRVGLVTNAYWATDPTGAEEWLRPLAGLVQDLSISSDAFHGGEAAAAQAAVAHDAARRLGIPVGDIRVAVPDAATACEVGQLPLGESGVMFRGRAAEKLAGQAPLQPWDSFATCPRENLREPGRVHVDPLGYVVLCQGIALGNLFATPLADLARTYAPDDDPVVGPLLAGGPAQLVRTYDLSHAGAYADACHLCDAARRQLRSHFPERLAPDQMYGVVEPS